MMRMDAFHALAEPARRKIIEVLASEGELSATDIYGNFRMSHPAVSQHLKVLREAGLVQMEKRAQQRIYRINPGAMLELEGWVRRMTRLWSRRLDRLDKALEKEKKGGRYGKSD